MSARIEIAPGVFQPCEPQPWSMEARQRILDTISDPTVQKILVMRWQRIEEITDKQAAKLIADYGLEGV